MENQVNREAGQATRNVGEVHQGDDDDGVGHQQTAGQAGQWANNGVGQQADGPATQSVEVGQGAADNGVVQQIAGEASRSVGQEANNGVGQQLVDQATQSVAEAGQGTENGGDKPNQADGGRNRTYYWASRIDFSPFRCKIINYVESPVFPSDADSPFKWRLRMASVCIGNRNPVDDSRKIRVLFELFMLQSPEKRPYWFYILFAYAGFENNMRMQYMELFPDETNVIFVKNMRLPSVNSLSETKLLRVTVQLSRLKGSSRGREILLYFDNYLSLNYVNA